MIILLCKLFQSMIFSNKLISQASIYYKLCQWFRRCFVTIWEIFQIYQSINIFQIVAISIKIFKLCHNLQDISRFAIYFKYLDITSIIYFKLWLQLASLWKSSHKMNFSCSYKTRDFNTSLIWRKFQSAFANRLTTDYIKVWLWYVLYLRVSNTKTWNKWQEKWRFADHSCSSNSFVMELHIYG